MKYKKIFTLWWFWLLVILFFGFRIWGLPLRLEFLPEYIGILLGSFIGVLFIISIFWILGKGLKKMFPEKVTKR